ncbi:MAG: CPBP family intramembrane metalloprotease [Methylococcales bacterium]|nr:CPBP family intramembrane metalloprotease [Methylococcales bacterium]
MDKSLFKFDDFFKSACYFEASLVLVALFLGWIAGIDPFEKLYFSEAAIAYGIIGTVPLFLMFLALEQMQGESIVKIRKLLLQTLGPGLHRYHWTDLFMLAAIAGVAEELLFRGVIQPWLESSWGMTAGLIGSNMIFGLVHAVTPVYAVLAAFVGIYLGLSLDYGGDRNLLTPVIIHALYDFLAFVALMRVYRASQLSDPE